MKHLVGQNNKYIETQIRYEGKKVRFRSKQSCFNLRGESYFNTYGCEIVNFTIHHRLSKKKPYEKIVRKFANDDLQFSKSTQKSILKLKRFYQILFRIYRNGPDNIKTNQLNP